jgi:hypothetical protein
MNKIFTIPFPIEHWTLELRGQKLSQMQLIGIEQRRSRLKFKFMKVPILRNPTDPS